MTESQKYLYNRIFEFVTTIIVEIDADRSNPNYVNSFQPGGLGRVEFFIDRLLSDKKNFDKSILDAGCGISALLLFLQRVGFQNLNGIDLNKYLLTKMDLLFRVGDNSSSVGQHNLLCHDIFTFDYSSFDFIYSFNPAFSLDKKSYYIRILDTMKVGGELYESYCMVDMQALTEIKSFVAIEKKKFKVTNLEHSYCHVRRTK